MTAIADDAGGPLITARRAACTAAPTRGWTSGAAQIGSFWHASAA